MNRIFPLIFAFVFAFSCKNTTKSPAAPQEQAAPQTENAKTMISEKQTIARIENGLLTFENGQTQAIPLFDDPEAIILFCVRHCEKAQDGTGNPPLTAEGMKRAHRLGEVLKGTALKRICTTNFKRTIETGEALVPYTMGPPLETFPPSVQEDWLQEILDHNKGGHFAVVGHQKTIPALLNRLLGSQKYDWIPDDEFGNLYVVSTKGIGKTEIIEGWYE